MESGRLSVCQANRRLELTLTSLECHQQVIPNRSNAAGILAHPVFQPRKDYKLESELISCDLLSMQYPNNSNWSS